MRTRWLAAWVLVFAAGPAAAQPRLVTAFEVADPPAQLPLVPVPGPNLPAAPFAPGGPVGEYQPGFLYLPEPGPEFARQPTLADELWRVSLAGEMAWLSTTPLPRTVRLVTRDVFGRTLREFVLPTDGRGTDSFQGGLGLNVGRRLGDRGGLDMSLFVLPGATRSLEGFAPGTLVYNTDTARDAPLFVRLPPGLEGVGSYFPATVSTTFVGLDVNYRHSVIRTQTARVDVLAGYRFAYLSDELFLGDQPYGTSDGYRANRLQSETTFHGGQLGVAVGLDYGVWYTDGVVKIAYGGVTTDTHASGAFVRTNPQARFENETRAAWLPTVGWRVGYRVSDRTGVFASYTFQYLDRVARLGDAFCPCGGHSDLWINSLGLGLECRF